MLRTISHRSYQKTNPPPATPFPTQQLFILGQSISYLVSPELHALGLFGVIRAKTVAISVLNYIKRLC